MKIAIARAFVPLEIDLWGEEFHTIDVPRSGAKKADALQAKLEEIDDDDKAVEVIAQLLDLKLAPAGPKKTKPSTLIKKKWAADELTMRGLLSFLAEIRLSEQSENDPNGRPT